MKIVSWNIAGIRAVLKKECFNNFIENNDADIICFQETKAEEQQVKLSELISLKYPFRYWTSTQGLTQRKGLSGTAIWSSTKPVARMDTPEFDTEGRITTLEFEKFILICVYTPNSQSSNSPRFMYRIEEWDVAFRKYINKLNDIKPAIICGDFNVAYLDIDMYNYAKYKNKAPGLYDEEREGFAKYLEDGFVDAFRTLYPNEKDKYTYWNQIRKTSREKNLGWRIDYFLLHNTLVPAIKECNILTNEFGSDHCPIYLIVDNL